MLSAFSRVLTGFLQMRGFTCGIDDLLLVKKAEQERSKIVATAEAAALKASADLVGHPHPPHPDADTTVSGFNGLTYLQVLNVDADVLQQLSSLPNPSNLPAPPTPPPPPPPDSEADTIVSGSDLFCCISSTFTLGCRCITTWCTPSHHHPPPPPRGLPHPRHLHAHSATPTRKTTLKPDIVATPGQLP